MNSMPDTYAQWEAAYVLGALSPAERHEFEAHLASCQRCQRAVAELAAMPGLLAQVSIHEIAPLPEDAEPGVSNTFADDPPPPSLMPTAITSLHSRRRRMSMLIGIAAALVLLAGAAGGFVLRGVVPAGGAPGPSLVAAPLDRLAFSPVVPSALTAVVDVVASPSGTEFRVECQYGTASTNTPGGAYADYAIYVNDLSGNSVLAKTWTAKPDRVMRPSAISPLPVSEIASVEIRDVDSGQTLVRAPLR